MPVAPARGLFSRPRPPVRFSVCRRHPPLYAMIHRILLLVACCVGLFLAGCDASSPGTDAPLGDTVTAKTQVQDSLTVSVTLPSSIPLGQDFTVTVDVSNARAEPISFKTSDGCLVVPRVTNERGERVGLIGSQISCAQVVVERTVNAGTTDTHTFQMRAASLFSEDHAPVRPGDYTMHMQIDWHFPTEAVQTDVTQEFIITD